MADRFFTESFRPNHRKKQQMCQVTQVIRPKIPDWAQPLGKGAEEHHRAANTAQYHKAPQLSLAPTQQEQKGDRPHHQTIEGIQNRRHPGHPQSEGPQQVIQQSGGQAQQDGLTEGQQLLGDLGPHHPNRRLNRPPRL